MKGLIVGIHGLFLALLAATVAMSFSAFDGLVEDGYYGKAAGYFALKEEEERIGLAVTLPDRVFQGKNRLAATVATAAGPLMGAQVALRAARLRGEDGDLTFPMREEAPGVYASDVALPGDGSWLFTLTIDGGAIRTRRSWLATAAPAPDAPGSAGDVHAGPVRAMARDQEVILEISPRPVRAMRELLFAVTLPGYRGPGAPRIDLAMPGMRMPPNRVDLVRERDGTWRGRGVVVRCASGNRRWTATVTLPGGGRAEVPFDVAE